MKALIKDPKKSGLIMNNLAIPYLTPGMALVEIRCAGICGTDLLFYQGIRQLPKAQMVILGHELTGVIRAISGCPQDLSVHVGDGVAIEMATGCGICTECVNDYKLGCQYGERIGITVDGGFAEYVAVPIANLCKLPEGLVFEKAVLADPLACAYKGTSKLTDRSISRALILGGGIIGFLCLQLLHQMLSVHDIVVIDRHPERLEAARNLGAFCAVEIDDDVITAKPFDLVVEASGSSELFVAGLGALRPRGVMLLLGVHLQVPHVSTAELLQKELEIIPSLMYGQHHMKVALELLSSGVIQVEPSMCKSYSLDQYAEAFDTALSKRVLKVYFHI